MSPERFSMFSRSESSLTEDQIKLITSFREVFPKMVRVEVKKEKADKKDKKPKSPDDDDDGF